ncbi:hypothetical protein [Alicyclobacillus suci]|uniref:hypothetical protein n=1 Tax=Alicyclobacillus suci TaxID=2816080 RepID=UPI001A8EF08E|nr:hypothetical protein [Alicyclobacillus suci]
MDAFDKRLFDWADALDPDDLMRIIEEAPITGEQALDASFLARVEARTLAKIEEGQAPVGASADGQPARGRIWRRRRVAALRWWGPVAAIFLLVVGVALHAPVLAQVHKLLEFLPGFGVVADNSTGTAPTTVSYVLKAPTALSVDGGAVEITGAVWGANASMIQVNGPAGVLAPKRITVIGPDGKKYVFHYEDIASGGPWIGIYTYQGRIPLSRQTNGGADVAQQSVTWGIVWAGSEMVNGHLTLTRAQTAADYRKFGPTETKNGVAITAIATKYGDTVGVTFVSPSSSQYQIEDYGLSGPLGNGPAVTVSDMDAGKRNQRIKTPPVSFEPTNVFQFNPVHSSDRDFLLTLPYITAKFQDTFNVAVPIPAPGQVIHWNHALTIAGMQVTMTTVSRTGNHVRVAVQVADKSSMKRRFLGFAQGPQDLSSFEYQFDQHTMNLNRFGFDVTGKNPHTMHLQLENPEVLLYGPWVYHLDVE